MREMTKPAAPDHAGAREDTAMLHSDENLAAACDGAADGLGGCEEEDFDAMMLRAAAKRLRALAPSGAAEMNTLASEINAINRANGWNVVTPDAWGHTERIITLVALVMTESAEAIEAVRHDDKENFAEEIADTMIRCLDIAGGLGIDIDAAIRAKLEKNRQRGYRHGGKRV